MLYLPTFQLEVLVSSSWSYDIHGIHRQTGHFLAGIQTYGIVLVTQRVTYSPALDAGPKNNSLEPESLNRKCSFTEKAASELFAERLCD